MDALSARAAELLDDIRALQVELIQSRADAANAAANAIAGLRRDVVPWHRSNTAMVAWRPAARR